jgi:hypothetical protein
MASLNGQTIASSYEQLLHTDTDGGGNGNTLVTIKDGDNGTTFGLKLATNKVEVIPSAADDANAFEVSKNDGTAVFTVDTSSPGFSLAGNATITTTDNSDNIALVSTDADANSGPNMSFWRNSGSPADNDLLGQINWYAENDADEKTHMAQFYVTSMDVSDGSEDVRFVIQTILGGATETSRIELIPSETVINQDSKDIDFRVESDGNANMLVVDAGNNKVGIGTASPDNLLQLEFADGSNTTAGNIADESVTGLVLTNTTNSNGNGTMIKMESNSGSNATAIGHIQGDADSASMAFYTEMDGTFAERLRITDAGAVGIGTTSPNGNVEISGSNGAELDLSSVKTSIGGTDPLGTIRFRSLDSDNSGVLGQIQTTIFKANHTHTTNIDGTDGEHTEMIFKLGDDVGSGISANMKETMRLRGDAGNFAMSIDAHGAYGLSIDSQGSTSSHDVVNVTNASDASIHTMYGDGTYRNTGGVRLQGSALAGTDTGISSSGSAGNLRFFTNGNQCMTLTTGKELAVAQGSTNIGGTINAFTQNGRWGIMVDEVFGNDALIDFRDDGTSIGNITIVSGNVSYNTFIGSHYSSLTTDNEDDIEIGTVLSTIDETHTRHLAKFKISDTVGDTRVYGVFAGWDGMYEGEGTQATISALGATEIRVTGACRGGDLLESNGDGTAKVQDDDIIRSKTIGKVTIGDSNTGVKLVSCVLYCG